MNSMSGEKLKGIPYTGTLPAVLAGTKAGYLYKYKIYGNTEQTGTPTPSNPIVPQECGERTENLWSNNDATLEEWISSTGEKITGGDARYGCTFAIPFNGENSYTLKYHDVRPYSYSIVFYDSNGDFIIRAHIANPSASGDTFTVPNNTASVIVQVATNVGTVLTREMLNSYAIMLNTGSTALPYEPYGYKLPLASAGQDVDIYLGESQTTRRIKKLVLTGEETWSYESSVGRFGAFIANFKSLGVRLTPFVTDRYDVVDDGRAIAIVPDNAAYTGAASTTQDGTYLYIHTSAYSSTNDFKTYLAQEYANGTPVTVWCILTSPTTGTLNEPLRKIGDYADTIDSTQTSAQIPTTANSTTISWAGQGLAPSEFDSIQEWVDIPTYTRVNGEWVADN